MVIDTGAYTDRQGHQCGYRQVHAQIDRDTSVGIDTGAHTVRQGHHCGYRHKCTQR